MQSTGMTTAEPGAGVPPPLQTLALASIRTEVAVTVNGHDGHPVPARFVTFERLADGREHVALRLGWAVESRNGPCGPGGRPPLVRLHSECLTGDVFGSARCDCGPQLAEAVERISATGGYLLYLRQEGRGIGLYNKLDAYRLQDQGLDTYEANLRLGLAADARDYRPAAQMLTALGCPCVDLLTNNPDKAQQLARAGICVRRTCPTSTFGTEHNAAYLLAKAVVTRHAIDTQALSLPRPPIPANPEVNR